MKTRKLLFIVISICIAINSFAAAKNSAESGTGREQVQPGKARAFVAQKAFIFEDALEGEIVSHAFSIENHGTAPLKVLDIRTSCGCTTAERPGLILPGTEECILVKGHTRGYGGRTFNKKIIVATNDPFQPKIYLQLSGYVVPFADIEPHYIVLRGKKDEIVEAEATITPNSKSPFRILSSELEKQLMDKIGVKIEQRSGIYHIIVSNHNSIPGNYRGRIFLKTDSEIQSTLTLFVKGYILE